jgi:hypothetical protein
MLPFGQNVQLYDWANKPASSTTDQAPATNRPGAALYTNSGGQAIQGGFVVLGSDYGASPRAQVPRVDANGVVSTTNAGAVYAGSSPAATSQLGPLVMGLAAGVARPLSIDPVGNLLTMQGVLPTYSAMATGVSISTGKSMFALVNGSTTGTVLRLSALYVVNTSTTTSALGSTYNIYAAELRPISGVSTAGTAGSIVPHDSSDVLDGNVKAYSGSTVSGDNVGALRRWVTSSYGLTTNASNAEAQNGEQQGRFPWVCELGGMSKPITVRPGAGIHVKIASTATSGFLDVTCIFTAASS